MAEGSGKRVWLITGVSRGLGRELAKAVLARGEVVVGTSRSGEADLDAGAGTLHMIALDLASPGRERAVVEEAHALHGRLDVLVNNAGYGLMGALEETDDAEAARLFEVDFFGPLRLIRAAVPLMRARGGGRIVNVSSIAGVAPAAGYTMYAAAKFALGGMSEGLAPEVAPFGIKVTVVEPGAFRTDFLSSRSLARTDARVGGYEETSDKVSAAMSTMDGKQAGDPARGARAILKAVDAPEPPLHLLLGSDAHRRAAAKLANLGAEYARWEAVTLGTDFPAGS